MKLQVSLACLLLALCLGSGAAGPLQGSGAGAGQGLGDAITNGVGKAIGEGAKEAVSSGIQDAIGKGDSGEASSAFRARGDALSNRLGEAAHALENTGNEAGKQAEKIIRHEMDVARNPTSWVSGTRKPNVEMGGYGEAQLKIMVVMLNACICHCREHLEGTACLALMVVMEARAREILEV